MHKVTGKCVLEGMVDVTRCLFWRGHLGAMCPLVLCGCKSHKWALVLF